MPVKIAPSRKPTSAIAAAGSPWQEAATVSIIKGGATIKKS